MAKATFNISSNNRRTYRPSQYLSAFSSSYHAVRPSAPFVMSSSSNGTVIRSSQRSMARISITQGLNTISNIVTLPNTVTLGSQDVQAHAKSSSNAAKKASIEGQKTRISTSASRVQSSPQTSPFRSQRQCKWRSIYQGELVQPRKRVCRCNWWYCGL